MTKHILLVDDDALMRRSLAFNLEQAGYRTSTAADAESALRLARRDPPDLILLDMSLPIMDGWEVARRLKSQDETKGIPIIALTAHAMAGDREKSLEAGCDDYDTKPVDFKRLRGKIDAILGEA